MFTDKSVVTFRCGSFRVVKMVKTSSDTYLLENIYFPCYLLKRDGPTDRRTDGPTDGQALL